MNYATTSETATMTSSANCKERKSKSITNFSIESIIGEDQDDLSHRQMAATVRQAHMPKRTGQKNNFKMAKKKIRPKNFRCPACPMAFSNNGQLKNHVRIHTGERPFECNHDQCGKTFTRNEELTRHKLIHSGDRPHTCTSCGKQFGRKDHLKKHARTHERAKRTRTVCKLVRPKRPNEEEAAQLKKQQIKQQLSPLGIGDRPPVDLTPLMGSGALFNSCACPNQEMIQTNALHSGINNNPLNCPSVSQIHNSCFKLPQHSTQLLPPPPPTGCLQNIPDLTSATTTIQRIASDYWNWYSLLGFQQQQQQHQQQCQQSVTNLLYYASSHCSPAKRLDDLLRKI